MDGNKKCHFNIFNLKYVNKEYLEALHRSIKVITNFHIGFQFDVKFLVGVKTLKKTIEETAF